MLCYRNRLFCFCCKQQLHEDEVVHFCREMNCETIVINTFYEDMCDDCIKRNCNKHINYLRFGWYRCNDSEIPPILYSSDI